MEYNPPDKYLENDVSLDRWLEQERHRKEHVDHEVSGETFQVLE